MISYNKNEVITLKRKSIRLKSYQLLDNPKCTWNSVILTVPQCLKTQKNSLWKYAYLSQQQLCKLSQPIIIRDSECSQVVIVLGLVGKMRASSDYMNAFADIAAKQVDCIDLSLLIL